MPNLQFSFSLEILFDLEIIVDRNAGNLHSVFGFKSFEDLQWCGFHGCRCLYNLHPSTNREFSNNPFGFDNPKVRRNSHYFEIKSNEKLALFTCCSNFDGVHLSPYRLTNFSAIAFLYCDCVQNEEEVVEV